MGTSSPRQRAPDEAAIAVLVGVERDGPADHGGSGKRSEVTAVEAVADLPVHKKQFAWATMRQSCQTGSGLPRRS